jgi:hypothetical protein
MALHKSERGQVIVLVVLLLVALLGVTALAVDGGRLYYSQRTAQNAADNAALSAAYSLCTGGNVATEALSSAVINGFDNDGVTNTVAVHHPPSSGPNTGDTEYVEVVINSQEETAFAQLVYSGAFETTVRAVGHCYSEGGPIGNGNGLIALAPSGDCTFNSEGSGVVAVQGGGVFVNSDSSSAFCVSGGGTGPGGEPRVEADWIDVVGSTDVDAWIDIEPDSPTTGVPPITDPLASLPAPPVPAEPGPAPSPDRGGCTTKPDPLQGGHLIIEGGWDWCTLGPLTIYPGSYNSITIRADVQVNLQPGLYYINGGDLLIEGPSSNFVNGPSSVKFFLDSGDVTIGGAARATLTAGSDGILFHVGNGHFRVGGNSTSSPIMLEGLIYLGAGGITVTGSGNVSLLPASSGTYSGMSVFLGHGNESSYSVEGAGIFDSVGTLYIPDGHVVVTGSGLSQSFTGQIIAYDFYIPGSGRLMLTYDPDATYQGGSGSAAVELAE